MASQLLVSEVWPLFPLVASSSAAKLLAGEMTNSYLARNDNWVRRDALAKLFSSVLALMS